MVGKRDGANAAPNSEDPLIYAKADGIAWLTLNRPDVLNAMNMRVRDALWDALHAAQDDPYVRAVIFKGAGERAFSAGADISEFGTAPSYAEARRARRERDVWGFMLSMDKPLVAAIQGYALGAGVELAMCCDFRIAAEEATFGLPEVSLGYIPSAGGTQTLPRHVPPGIAMQMVLTGDPIDAATAHRCGLVHRLVPRERLYAEAEALARRLMQRSPLVLALAKRAVYDGLEMSLPEAVAYESALAARLLATDEGRAAVARAAGRAA